MTDERVVRLLRELVGIESVNLAYPGGTGEAAMAGYVENWAREAGFRVERQELETGQANVLVALDVPNATGTLPGSSSTTLPTTVAACDTSTRLTSSTAPGGMATRSR